MKALKLTHDLGCLGQPCTTLVVGQQPRPQREKAVAAGHEELADQPGAAADVQQCGLCMYEVGLSFVTVIFVHIGILHIQEIGEGELQQALVYTGRRRPRAARAPRPVLDRARRVLGCL